MTFGSDRLCPAPRYAAVWLDRLIARRTNALAVGIEPHADQQLRISACHAPRAAFSTDVQSPHDRDQDQADRPTPRLRARDALRRSAAPHPQCAEATGIDQSKPSGERMSVEPTPGKCTQILENSRQGTSTWVQFLHSFQTGRYHFFRESDSGPRTWTSFPVPLQVIILDCAHTELGVDPVSMIRSVRRFNLPCMCRSTAHRSASIAHEK